jgi:T5SS/PEP-CTERM-associated repeat protein
MKSCRVLPAGLKVLVIVGMMPLFGHAATSHWNTDSSGSFSNAANWSPMSVPGNADDAVFMRGGKTYTVTFLSGASGFPQPVYTTHSVNVNSDAVTFARTFGGIGPAFVADSTTLDPASERGIAIGVFFGDNGSLTTSILTSAVAATIGDDFGSTGELHVTSHSTLNITGTTPDYVLYVGRRGSGTLLIDTGAQFKVQGSESRVSVGDEAGSFGEVDVDGTGSNLSITGPFFEIGNSGTGVVAVTGGGEVDAFVAVLGFQNGSAGAVTVDGTGSTFHTVGTMSLGFDVSGSTAQGKLTVKNGGSAVIGGELTVSANGAIAGNSTINAHTVTTSGFVLPGGIPGTPIAALHVTTNDFTLNAPGHLQIQLGGITRDTQYDALLVDGAVHLGGALDVSLANSFAPAAGNAFDVLDGTTIDGVFSAINLPALAAGLMWNASLLSTTGVLSVQLLGDYNGNGVVDAADYVVYRKTLGQTGIALAADGNGNHQIDSGDYSVWRAHFGQTAGSGAVAASTSRVAVPEPSSALLLLGAIVILGLSIHDRSPGSRRCRSHYLKDTFARAT